ncbi:MAG TPA: PEGA domain-containing protein [Kofleriaceae bacterium]|nr:PEGA domain-containing protein [Kofleriaceae bacterium]
MSHGLAHTATAAFICAACSALGAVGSAHAEPEARRARVPVAVFLVGPDGPLSPSRHATLLLTMEKALQTDRRLDVIDKDRRLTEVAGRVPREALSEARGLLLSGEALLRKGKAKLGLVRLQAAEVQLARALAWARKADLARTQFLVGVAHAMLGDRARAEAAFLRLLTWRPAFVIDTSIEPGKVFPAWEGARAQLARLPGGSLDIRSTPDRALAYVDGRFVGFTPTATEGLSQGTHYVTLKKVGYERAVVEVEVSGKVNRKASAELVASEGADGITTLVAAIAPSLGKARASAELDELATLLGVQHAMFVRVPEIGEDSIYEGFLISTKDRKVIARASGRTSDERGVDQVFSELARALYAQVVFEPLPPPTRTTDANARRNDRRFYQTWWFWTGVGALAAGATLPLVLGEDQGPRCPGGAVCGDVRIDF